MDIERVDPTLRDLVRGVGKADVSKWWIRALGRVLTPLLRPKPQPGVTAREVREGGARVRIHEPSTRRCDGALLWVHGGGYISGSPAQDEQLCAATARALGIPVLAARYRVAPAHPFPTPLDDVDRAWEWMLRNAASLGIEPARVVVGGESAGGGLAAALVQRIHDRGGVQPIGQWLFAPMLDDRTAADTTLDALDHWVWNNANNRFGWASYLGMAPGAARVPEYAVPGRRLDLAGLPPAYITVGDIDLFRDEDLRYAEALAAGGVPVTTDVVSGGPHGVVHAEGTAIARELLTRAHVWLRAVFDDAERPART